MARSIIILFGCASLVALVLLLSQSKKLLSSRANESNELAMSTTNYTHAAAREGGPFDDDSMASARQQLLLLHRQKRYLVFPEGSSFQLVFDLIIPIVDYTNFAILGITCAVAWELPSKPPSELLENLRTRLNDGTLGTVRRTDSVQQETVVMAETSNIRTPINWQAMHAPPTSVSAAAASTYASNVHNYPYHTTNVRDGAGTSAYANSPNGQQHAGRPTNWHARQSIPKWRQWAAAPTSRPPLRGSNDRWSDNWWQRNKDRVQQNWRRKQQQWSFYQQPTWSTYGQPMQRQEYSNSYAQRPRQVLQRPPEHHIYPVFGRRRRRRRDVPDQLAKDDIVERLHLQQHLSSRGLLFGKIERLYKTRQLNGTACIQRALCESAQRLGQTMTASAEPQSFIMELVSAIFQLPSDNEAAEVLLRHIPPHYVEAHQQQGNCRQIYAGCTHTFWMQ